VIDYGRVLLTVECSAVCLLAPTDTHVIVKSRPHNGRPVKHAAVPLRSLVTTVSCYGTLLLIITCFKFGDDRFRGLASAEGQILPFPIDFDGRPYNTLTLPCERVM